MRRRHSVPGRAASTVFGPGALEEVGDHAASFELTRVALFTDENLSHTEHVEAVT